MKQVFWAKKTFCFPSPQITPKRTSAYKFALHLCGAISYAQIFINVVLTVTITVLS